MAATRITSSRTPPTPITTTATTSASITSSTTSTASSATSTSSTTSSSTAPSSVSESLPRPATPTTTSPATTSSVDYHTLGHHACSHLHDHHISWARMESHRGSVQPLGTAAFNIGFRCARHHRHLYPAGRGDDQPARRDQQLRALRAQPELRLAVCGFRSPGSRVSTRSSSAPTCASIRTSSGTHSCSPLIPPRTFAQRTLRQRGGHRHHRQRHR